ncbi:hypothetical protein [Prevotella nigrescens]|nr:hypothetical protein [Prevotella nigrescens]
MTDGTDCSGTACEMDGDPTRHLFRRWKRIVCLLKGHFPVFRNVLK